MPAAVFCGKGWNCSTDNFWLPGLLLAVTRTFYIGILLSVTVELGAVGAPLRWDASDCVLPRLALVAVAQLLLHGVMLAVECGGTRLSIVGAPM